MVNPIDMRRRAFLSSAASIVCPSLATPNPAQGQTNDSPASNENVASLVLRSGKLITIDDRFTIAQAVAIRDDRIVAVGSDEQIRLHSGPHTRVLDLIVGTDRELPGALCKADLARHGRGGDFLFDDPERSALALVWSPRGDRIAFAVGQFFPMVGRWRSRGLPELLTGRQAIGVPVRRRTNARLANHRNSRRIESQA